MADVIFVTSRLLDTVLLIEDTGPETTKSITPKEFIAPAPKLDALPPPTLYWMKSVVFPLTADPRDMLFIFCQNLRKMLLWNMLKK